MYDSDYREKRRQRRWFCLPVQNAITPPVTRISLPSAMAGMHSTMCLLPHGTPFDTPWVALPLSHTLPVLARHQGIRKGLSRPHYVVGSRYFPLDTTIPFLRVFRNDPLLVQASTPFTVSVWSPFVLLLSYALSEPRYVSKQRFGSLLRRMPWLLNPSMFSAGLQPRLRAI